MADDTTAPPISTEPQPAPAQGDASAEPAAAATAAPEGTAAPAEAPPNPSRPAETGDAGEQSPHRQPAFLRQVEAWANGQDVPDNATIKGCLEDLRACLGARGQIQQQVQQLESTLRQQQAELFASQGREDALLRVCFRAQAS